MPVTDEFVYENIDTLEKYTCGFPIGEYLGRGAYGTVFSVKDNWDWVIKITKDIEEVFACEQILNLRGKGYEATLFPGFAEIYTVDKVEELTDDCEDLFVIVRERIEPLNSTIDSEFINDLDNFLYVIEEKQAYSKKELAEAMSFVETHAPALHRSILEAHYHNFTLLDICIHNIGVTCRKRYGVPSGSLVMFDVAFNIDSEREKDGTESD